VKVITAKIEYKWGDTITVKPLFDVHYGAKACDIRGFKQYLEESNDKTYFIGGGDLLDSIHANDIRYRKSGDAFEGDNVIDQQINGMIDILKPYKDKIICLATGNHEDVVTKRCGTNPTKRMCETLDVPFLGYSGLIRLLLSENGARGRKVIIRLHHGWGGGSRTQGADLTKYSKDLQYWDADIFLYGHTHRKQTDQVPRLGLVGEKLISRPKTMAICGTWLKTYSTSSDPTYSEIKGYPPIETGGVSITLKPTHKWVKVKAQLD